VILEYASFISPPPSFSLSPPLSVFPPFPADNEIQQTDKDIREELHPSPPPPPLSPPFSFKAIFKARGTTFSPFFSPCSLPFQSKVAPRPNFSQNCFFPSPSQLIINISMEEDPPPFFLSSSFSVLSTSSTRTPNALT